MENRVGSKLRSSLCNIEHVATPIADEVGNSHQLVSVVGCCANHHKAIRTRKCFEIRFHSEQFWTVRTNVRDVACGHVKRSALSQDQRVGPSKTNSVRRSVEGIRQ